MLSALPTALRTLTPIFVLVVAFVLLNVLKALLNSYHKPQLLQLCATTKKRAAPHVKNAKTHVSAVKSANSTVLVAQSKLLTILQLLIMINVLTVVFAPKFAQPNAFTR
jgi:ATP/ADP translocase